MRLETSVPYEDFLEAERLADSLGISKSELLRQALVAYVKAKAAGGGLQSNDVLENLNEVYPQESSEIDEVLLGIQWASLSKEDW